MATPDGTIMLCTVWAREPRQNKRDPLSEFVHLEVGQLVVIMPELWRLVLSSHVVIATCGEICSDTGLAQQSARKQRERSESTHANKLSC